MMLTNDPCFQSLNHIGPVELLPLVSCSTNIFVISSGLGNFFLMLKANSFPDFHTHFSQKKLKMDYILHFYMVRKLRVN